MFEFTWIWVLALLPLPWLVKRFTRPVSLQRQSAVKVPFMDDLIAAGAAPQTESMATQSRLWWLGFLAWALLLVAAAGPRWLGEPIPQQREGREMMLAIDLSASMQERDFVFQGRRLNRLTATQLVASDFIQRREGDRIGLVLFGDQAYLQAPLTYDRGTVQTLLDEAQIGLAGQRTAIGDAIGLTVKRLRDSDNPNKVMVLLTDGTNTAGALESLQAAKLAADEGVKIYSIGIGRDSTDDGLFGSFFQPQRAPELDEKTLTAIAEQTGGKYYRARDLSELVTIYDQLDQLEPVSRDQNYFRPQVSLYHWPLAIALLLFVVIALLKGRR